MSEANTGQAPHLSATAAQVDREAAFAFERVLRKFGVQQGEGRGVLYQAWSITEAFLAGVEYGRKTPGLPAEEIRAVFDHAGAAFRALGESLSGLQKTRSVSRRDVMEAQDPQCTCGHPFSDHDNRGSCNGNMCPCLRFVAAVNPRTPGTVDSTAAAEAILRAVREERERCIRAVCSGCEKGWSVLKHPTGPWWHDWPDTGIPFECKAKGILMMAPADDPSTRPPL
jgi:hypothetical protein